MELAASIVRLGAYKFKLVIVSRAVQPEAKRIVPGILPREPHRIVDETKRFHSSGRNTMKAFSPISERANIPSTGRGVVAMGRVAFAMLLLSLHIFGQASVSNEGKASLVGGGGSGSPAGITYATTALNWTQTITSPLTGGSQATITLAPCPIGVDTTSGSGYQVLISGRGSSEAVKV